MLATSMQSARPRGAFAVRDGHDIPQSRASVLRRCSSAGSPNAPQQQPLKAAPKPSRAGLVSIAGDLHLRIDAINVHLTASAVAQPGQQDPATMVQSGSNLLQAGQDLATTLQSAVMDAATSAIAGSLAAPSGEPAPIAPVSPYTCVGAIQSPDACPLYALAMCSDGHHFICGYGNGDMALWDGRKPGHRVVVQVGKLDTIQAVAVSADCGRALVGGQSGLWLWDVAQGKVTALLDEDTEEDEEYVDVWSVSITPDGRYGVSGGYSQGLRVWDLEKGECIGSEATIGRALAVVVSPDGQTAAAVVDAMDGGDSQDGSEDCRVDGHQVWRWHADSGFSKPVKLQGCPQESEFSMSADGGVVLSVDDEGVVQRWDVQSGKGEAIFAQPAKVPRLAVVPDGRRVVLANEEGVLSVWDVEGKACLATLDDQSGDKVYRLAISGDGRHAVSYCHITEVLHVWHLG